MNNCNTCEPKYVPGYHRVPHKKPCPPTPPVSGFNPTPNMKPTKVLCCQKPANITLRTQVLPANLGTDAEGQPYAPAVGSFYDTIVHYLANGAVYLYDSNGVFTQVTPSDYAVLVETVASYKQALAELYDPTKIALMVKTEAELQSLAPTVVPAGQFVLVVEDETHDGRPYLYSYDAVAQKWVAAYAASPYYEKTIIDSFVANLQTNINNVMNKEMQDVDNLQTNINTEVNAREAADTEINQRITDIQNSPDVRFIVGTYAELEELDKAEVGDKDYARVLQDENHEGASTYYQFSLADQTWTYVGEVGSYYTKDQIDAKFEEVAKVPASMVYDFVSPAGDNNPSTADNAKITARVVNTTTGATSSSALMMPMASETQAGSITAADKSKLDSLLEIKSLNDSLSLSEDGELSVNGGGGSSISLLSAYTASPAEGDVYNATYVNGRLDRSRIAIGKSAISQQATLFNDGGIAIGNNAKTLMGSSWGNSAIALGYNATCNSQSVSGTNLAIAIGYSASVTNSSIGIAIGGSATTSNNRSVAIGYQSTTTRDYEVSFGKSDTTRVLANVTAGELDTDAVNVSQLNAAIARIEALEAEIATLKNA